MCLHPQTWYLFFLFFAIVLSLSWKTYAWGTEKKLGVLSDKLYWGTSSRAEQFWIQKILPNVDKLALIEEALPEKQYLFCL